jgi:hypothetical protein
MKNKEGTGPLERGREVQIESVGEWKWRGIKRGKDRSGVMVD